MFVHTCTGIVLFGDFSSIFDEIAGMIIRLTHKSVVFAAYRTEMVRIVVYPRGREIANNWKRFGPAVGANTPCFDSTLAPAEGERRV